ncbi:MAG: copper-binding protein [Candidatus Rokuibacteriota bacterium]
MLPKGGASSRTRWLPAGLFVLLLAAFAVGLWGTVVRPAAYEITGEVIARPAANLILIRHDPVEGLGMGAMELMAVFGEPQQIDAAALAPGERVRLGVRSVDGQITLLRIAKRF